MCTLVFFSRTLKEKCTNVKAKDADDQAESNKEKQARQSMDTKAKADKCQDKSSKEK